MINNLEKKYLEGALTEIGRIGQNELQNANEAEDTGRLENSFSFATPKKKARVSSPARPSDGAPQPDEPNAVNIGTCVPYARGIDQGTSGKGELYDEDGNPETWDNLYEKIKVWLAKRGHDDESFAVNLTNRIMMYGTMAQPFFHEAVRNTERMAPEVFVKWLKEWGKGFKREQEVINLTLRI